MFQDITIDEWASLRQAKEMTTIDVRSPGEFEESTIPDSVNVPFFNNEERAEIGTLYKQVGVQAAKERGLEVISAKLPSLIREIGAIPGKKSVFCWRGGMRSRTTATLLSLMDIHVYRLTGGYRAYRNWVLDNLATMTIEPPAFVLNGLTGSGKTKVLNALASRGHAVLDLEGMAGHRGSIFGEIGRKANNQKMFDALLFEQLLRYRQAPSLLFEAEGKRIGRIVQPEVLIRKREEAKEIWLELPLEVRVSNLLEDYRPWAHKEQIMSAFRVIKSQIHTPIAAEIETCLRNEKYERAAELLLLYYYDPRYQHSSGQHATGRETVLHASSVEDATRQVEELLKSGS
ncbi:tRNA 2-selenouridine(34) synthase MnmH [Cohnella thailandensis]|uniref:tRNA 2-selenouridine(34) synthase MnmH n=1 Tax=Cohnella thailandensis TaxID=557557 RepID=A0A841T2Z9_9BACL|nr:tRNA 2-selenouridine(34) synthase MnmH [Cohnella thailandensis]MBB6636985.1 tRNA 2-selenouridine(34) synthase MnmH [Cohnella thailandensis]MBP1973132.1 tRNA 2-selenouridine synthase [Cohnella thailandensis]